MRAAVARELPGEPVLEVAQAAEPRRDEVLVRTVASGICGSDLQVLDGRRASQVPVILGHEAAGVVEQVGQEVTGLKLGDRVLVCQSSSCGSCQLCQRGYQTLCRADGLRARSDGSPRVTVGGLPVHLGSGIGAFAEFMLVHERSVIALPEGIGLVPSSLLGCAVITGLGAVFRTARVRPGATVAVVGTGAVGLSCVQGARIAGASRIIAIDANDDRLRLARELGATDTVLAQERPVRAVKDMTGGGVEYSFEAVGQAATIEQAFSMLQVGGVCTVIGLVPKAERLTIKASALLGERRLQGSANGSNRFRIDVPRYIELYRQGSLRLDELVGATVPLDGLADGIQSMLAGRSIRAVITISEE